MSDERTEQAWLDATRARISRGELPAAQAALDQALDAYPTSRELRRMQAGLLLKTGRVEQAEALLRALLECDASDAAAAFALARILKEQGRMGAAAATLRACIGHDAHRGDADLAIATIELLDDCDRKHDAAEIAEAAVDAKPGDARLHAYAGMLEIQLGEFARARQHYLFALQHDPHAWEWHVAIGLVAAQRYPTASHPDFALLRNGLQRESLSVKARAELHFALGKAHDDVADYITAARYFRQGNALAGQLSRWSRKAWRRVAQARMIATPFTNSAGPTRGFTPIFIVGVPRSGTTLLAELLSRHPCVRNRGELPWIAQLAGLPALTCDAPVHELEQAAATYIMQTRRDDAADVRWFIDKQPLNLRYVDLMLALFADARIVYCRRNARDTALSLWMQCFLEDVQGYSYDFADIEVVMRDCDKLMAHWHRHFAPSIHTVDYERLVRGPESIIDELAAWIGLPPIQTWHPAPMTPDSTISTASLWQARQPIHTRSVHRAERYLPYVPELTRWTDA